MFDTQKIRQDFPILQKKIHGKPLIYLDSASTSQKPRQVIDAISNYYENYNANVHRGIHTLAEESTEMYEAVRKKVAKFINAKSEKEIIFVRNTTEALNLVAYTYGRTNIKKADEIVTTIMEHHSNFVPWQQLAQEKEAKFKVIDIDDEGKLVGAIHESPKIWAHHDAPLRIIALTHVSNVLGTINPVKKIISNYKLRTTNSPLFVIDGAQAVPHLPVDVQDLDCDFYAFSAHKMLGPMGVGVLYGKEEILKQMPPFLFGGGMIKEVNLDKTDFADIPDRFEAGTPDVAGVVGLGAAIDYLETAGFPSIKNYELRITDRLLKGLLGISEVTVYGPEIPNDRIGVVSFSIEGIHPHDIAQFLNDRYNIAIRAGHHCTMPLHKRLGISATARASLYLYNTEEEIDIFVKAIKDCIKIFGPQ